MSGWLGTLADTAGGWLSSAWAAAIAGRLAWHTRLVQKGTRKFFSPELLLEIPIVVFTYILGVGAAAHWGWTGTSAGAVVALASYFGPAGLQMLAQAYARARVTGRDD